MTTRRTAGRGLALLAGAAAAIATVVLPARPAAADAPRPTDYRSEVLRVSPKLPPGMTVEVVGGDAFLELHVPRGHTAVVDDYAAANETEPAPYLRFQADGTVQRNRNAVATAANESRFGTTDETPDPDAEPDWETVATDGTYAWHDHRIHWMSPTRPRAVNPDGRVDLGGRGGTWLVPLTVDGTPTGIIGQLVLEDPPSPLPWALLALIVGAGAVAAGLRLGIRVSAAGATVIASAAVGVSWATWSAAPAGSGASWLPVAVPVVAVFAAVLAAWGPDRARLAAVAAAAAALVGWGLVRGTVLLRAELPTTLPFWIDRAVTASALGAGAGLAVLLVWKPPVRSSPTA